MSLARYENIGLSDSDLNKLVSGRAKIVIYGEVQKYKRIEDMLGRYGACFLLYEMKPNYGHWCLIFKRSDSVLEFFDPYGEYIDDELLYVPREFRNMSGQGFPHLSKLLYNYKGKIEYNEFPFQSEEKGIRTCGRWCVVRLWYRWLNLEQFKDLFLSSEGDKIVTYLTKWVNR